MKNRIEHCKATLPSIAEEVHPSAGQEVHPSAGQEVHPSVAQEVQLGLAVDALQLSAVAQGSTSIALLRSTGGAGLPLQAHPQGGIVPQRRPLQPHPV